jgi:hypothetical protein
MKPLFVYGVVVASPVFSGFCFSVAEKPLLRLFKKALKGSIEACLLPPFAKQER